MTALKTAVPAVERQTNRSGSNVPRNVPPGTIGRETAIFVDNSSRSSGTREPEKVSILADYFQAFRSTSFPMGRVDREGVPKRAECQRSNVNSESPSRSVRSARVSPPTDFHIRCLRHGKCPYSARFCDRNCCLDPILAPRAASALAVNTASPSKWRSSFGRAAGRWSARVWSRIDLRGVGRAGDQPINASPPSKDPPAVGRHRKKALVRKFHLIALSRGSVSKSWALCALAVRCARRLTSATWVTNGTSQHRY
jgi:hypothetical protein